MGRPSFDPATPSVKGVRVSEQIVASMSPISTIEQLVSYRSFRSWPSYWLSLELHKPRLWAVQAGRSARQAGR